MELKILNQSNLKNHSCPRSQRGAALVEYAMLVALIAVIAIAGVRTFGQQVGVELLEIGTEVASAGIGQ